MRLRRSSGKVTSGKVRPGHISTTRMLLLGVIILALGATGCIGRAARPLVVPGAPQVQVLSGTQAQTVPAGQLCPSTPGLAVLECTIFPVFPESATRCATTTTTGHNGPPCLLPKPGSELNMAWTLTERSDGTADRVLTLFRGTDMLTSIVGATDSQGPHWLAVAVCPRDIDGDGLLDAVMTFRTADNPDQLWVDTVRLNEPQPQVLTLPQQRAPLSDGQGCQAKVVQRLAYNPKTKQLKIDRG